MAGSGAKFGTDGIRGRVNADITVELAVALGRAVVASLGATAVLIGADTRASSPMLAAAVAAGVCSEGAHAVDLEVIPTPGLAFYARMFDVPAVMISASHNPAADNGLKVFGPGGRKLSDEQQAAIEALLASQSAPTASSVGSLWRRSQTPQWETARIGALEDYEDFLVEAGGGAGALSGHTVVLDAAHGAAFEIGPRVLARLGATVRTIGVDPDGDNINNGVGSIAPEQLIADVVTVGAAGVALDGDADRCLAVDETGQLVDGDQIIAACALDLAARGQLAGNAIAVTVMSNLGLRQAMAAAGIDVIETKVGDRYVAQAMNERGLVLGGEQSGHIIFGDLAATGDGMLTAVRLLDVMHRTGRSLTEVTTAAMTRLPQVLVNVRLASGTAAEALVAAQPEADAASAELGDTGRVLLRASGTEPVVRVMVEGPDEAQARQLATAIAASIAT